jgi:hypothetical protein
MRSSASRERTDLSLHSQAKLNAIARQLNERPPKDLALSNPSRQVRRMCCSDELNSPPGAVTGQVSTQQQTSRERPITLVAVSVGPTDDFYHDLVGSAANALRDRDAYELQRYPSTDFAFRRWLLLRSEQRGAGGSRRRLLLYRAVAEPVSPVLRLGWRYTPRRVTGSRP